VSNATINQSRHKGVILKYTLLAFTLVAACAFDEPGDETSDTQQAVDSPNGTSLNGTSLNGTSLNGTSLNGTSLNGTSLNGTSLNGTSLSATSGLKQPWTGSLVGSQWPGTASNGQALTLRIDSATKGTAPNADLWFYGISYQSTGGWTPLCGVDASNVPIAAVSMPGVWDTTATWSASSTQFTLACRGKSIAKCIELGYKPWNGYGTHLEACTRLLRADYCGSGVSHTVDGTLLNLYDNIGIQQDTESWTPEAEWSATGARCLHSKAGTRYYIDPIKEPHCMPPVVLDSCGTAFHTGALLIDELSPAALAAIAAGH
jgi:uncharacterized protein YjbI with pentapeptide repeats